MSLSCQVRMEFCRPPADLAAYFTSFYIVDIQVPAGGRVSDYLHPEWGNLRFFSGRSVQATAQTGDIVADTGFFATGPSSKALHFSTGTTRMWGVGLLPLGWAKFLRVAASDFADVVLDGSAHPDMAGFAALAAGLFGPVSDRDAELAWISAWFRARLHETVADEARILAIHAALVDSDVTTVSALVERAGASPRTVERLCCRVFGFPPKLLLRRQRFMRSLSQFMLDPSLRWIGAMDCHYHDQAQFVRDFRKFMGMSPREYGGLDHPILDVFVRERQRLAGSPVQALDDPRGGSLALRLGMRGVTGEVPAAGGDPAIAVGSLAP